MPAAGVPRRVEDFILYYYAKLVIAPSAGQGGNYAFIMDCYSRLRSGEMRMSDYDREIQMLAEDAGRCAFCGRHRQCRPVEVIPRGAGGPVGLHNLVYGCDDCATSKAAMDFIWWWCRKLGRDKNILPRVPIGLYLKMAYERHRVGFTLQAPCRDICDIWDGKRSERGR
jgi:hypothetical protein